MSVKFLLLGGGGECRFYFYGRADFSDFQSLDSWGLSNARPSLNPHRRHAHTRTQKKRNHWFATPPACYRSSRAALRARSVPRVSLRVSLGPFGPRRLRSVQKASQECSRSVKKVLERSRKRTGKAPHKRAFALVRPKNRSSEIGVRGYKNQCSRSRAVSRSV